MKLTFVNLQPKPNAHEYRLTPHNLQFLASQFEGEDKYKHNINNLYTIVGGLGDIVEKLPPGPERERAWSLFETVNNMMGAMISGKRPPYHNFKKDDYGNWL